MIDGYNKIFDGLTHIIRDSQNGLFISVDGNSHKDDTYGASTVYQVSCTVRCKGCTPASARIVLGNFKRASANRDTTCYYCASNVFDALQALQRSGNARCAGDYIRCFYAYFGERL